MDQYKKLLISHGFMWFGREIFKLFIGLYIWKLTSSLPLVATFYIIYSFFHIIPFYLFGNTIKKGNIRLTMMSGLIGMIFLLITFFVLREQSINYIIPLSIVFGLFNGLYWISYHVFRFDLTTTKSRGKYIGFEKGMRSFGLIAAPIVGGWLILQNFFNLDYGLVFIVGCASYLLALLTSNIKYKMKQKSKLKIKQAFKKIMKVKDIRNIFLSQFFSFMGRGGNLAILIPIFLFDILKSEFQVGGLLTGFAIVGIISAVLIGKFLNYKYYKKIYQISIALFIVSLLMLIGFPGLLAYIIFGFVKGVLGSSISIPRITYNLNILNKNFKEYQKMRVEYIIIRETIGSSIGSVVGYSLLFFVTGLSSFGMQMVLILMTFAVFLEFLFFSRVKAKLEKIK